MTMWNVAKRRVQDFLGAPFQVVLVVSFSLVAATTILIGIGAISHTVRDYLAGAMAERVERDMHLARSLYDGWREDIARMTLHLALDPLVMTNLEAANQGDAQALAALDRQIASEITAHALKGNQWVTVLDATGQAITGRRISTDNKHAQLATGVQWASQPIVVAARAGQTPLAATEILPLDLLTTLGLAEQARIQLVDTPRAAQEPFDAREGQAGLTLIGITPIQRADGTLVGFALAGHLFNNDFNLVDQIKAVADIDTVTIFLGDLRVSTNVRTPDGERAIGTRLSAEVSQVVLRQGEPYIGPAFVVNEDYITRYDPLRDHAGNIVGILYVGARQTSFSRLVSALNQRMVLVALATILATFLLAIPVSRVVTRPLKELRELAEANRRVAGGDMSVRVPVRAGGDVGELARSFNTMLDELQATQDQLVHSEKLASLGQLAAGVAHQLNNPLASVLLFSDILQRECAPEDPRRADLDMIVNETKRCRGIVAALLDFARQNQVVAQPTNLNALVDQVLELERKHAAEVPITFVRELDPHLPEIEADTAQLHEVLVNLISNAIEAMPNGGRLTVRTQPGPAGMVALEVSDTGVGVAPEDQAKLFVPFFTTKPIGKGTGLGLAIVYGIIKMHRGQITVQSQVDKGATFRVLLPIRLSPGIH